MNDNMELINVTVYEPTNSLFGKKSDKAEASYFYCSSKDSCSYFANNECLNVANLFRGSCPFGKRRTVTGYTPRARSYRKWIEEIRDKNREHLYALKRARDAVGFVGEWVCLPYAHMSLDNKLFKRPSGFCSSGEPFIHIEDWNVETAYALISRRPQAMMGGEIKSYRSEVVPKFCKDLQDLVPEFYNDLITSHPDVKCITESYSYVGRKALIHSLRAGVEIKKRNDSWVWDGEKLTSNNHKILFPVVDYDSITVSIKPKKDENIEITDNSQVDENTIFAD